MALNRVSVLSPDMEISCLGLKRDVESA